MRVPPGLPVREVRHHELLSRVLDRNGAATGGLEPSAGNVASPVLAGAGVSHVNAAVRELTPELVRVPPRGDVAPSHPGIV